MKPAFALNLSQDGLALLHRSGTGWHRVGDVSFEDPDLDGALARLRAEAHRIEPDGIATKVILPESQILYTEVEAPGPHAAEREAQIARALKGRTPYDVSELAFDWTEIGGGMVQVAVVARLTLAEAEEFAEAQGLNPVSFVALPRADQFGGEPFFGETAKATARLFGKLTRDTEPVSVPPDAAPDPGPVHKPGMPAPDVTSGLISDSEHFVAAEAVEPTETLTQAIIPEDSGAILPMTVSALAAEPENIEAPEIAEEAPFIAVEEEPEAEEPSAAFATRRSTAAIPGEAGLSSVVKRLHLSEGDSPEAVQGPASEAAAVTAPILPIPPAPDLPTPEPKPRAPRALPSSLPDARHGTQAQLRARRSDTARETSAAEDVRDRAASALSGLPVKPVAIGAGILALLALAASLFFGGDDPAPEAPASSGAIETPAPTELATAAPAPATPAETPAPAPSETAPAET
ncbi:MAG: hypothetical protein KDE00_01965, partial [Rhodobacteraceae bacterium]|nr:hypothetical protein [Paracoccaceae bacterium]